MVTDVTSNIKQTVRKLKGNRETAFCAYMYDLQALRAHIGHAIETLPSACRLYYAVKANSEDRILQELASYVHGFEVASIGEIEKVRRVSATTPILFGGPGKTDDELVGAIRHNVKLFNVESLHELKRLNHIAEQLNTNVPVALRVNLQTAVPDAKLKMAGVPTQFGIEEQAIAYCLQIMRQFPAIDLKGFHFHAMSNNLHPVQHASFVQHCIERVNRWKQEFQLDISYVNVGGGIGINYTNPNEQFEWDRFVNCLNDVIGRNEASYEIIFELGRYITAACGYYAAEVVDIKQNHGKYFAILRGGTHHLRLPAAWKMNHPFTVVPIETWQYPFERPEVREAPVTIAGELCTPNDVLARDVHVNELRAGDIIVFHYAGAYGWVISHHDFLSHPHPEHIFIE